MASSLLRMEMITDSSSMYIPQGKILTALAYEKSAWMADDCLCHATYSLCLASYGDARLRGYEAVKL